MLIEAMEHGANMRSTTFCFCKKMSICIQIRTRWANCCTLRGTTSIRLWCMYRSRHGFNWYWSIVWRRGGTICINWKSLKTWAIFNDSIDWRKKHIRKAICPSSKSKNLLKYFYIFILNFCIYTALRNCIKYSITPGQRASHRLNCWMVRK